MKLHVFHCSCGFSFKGAAVPEVVAIRLLASIKRTHFELPGKHREVTAKAAAGKRAREEKAVTV